MTEQTVLQEACKLLGWQGGTIHQVIQCIVNMQPKNRKAVVKKLRDFCGKSNMKDSIWVFLELYLKPISQLTGEDIL